jgi:HAD superfamily hydrolase (TIGR01509 family)
MREGHLPADVKAIIFDVEGTLVDTVALTLRCWHETLSDFGHQIPIAVLQRHSGQDGADMLRQLVPEESDVARARIRKAQGERYKARYLPQALPFPGVAPLFEHLHARGSRLALATDCSADELARYVEICGIAGRPDAVACGDDVSRGKPHGDLVALALHRLGARASETTMVGDTPFDMTAATALGSRALGLLSGGFTEADLRAAGARYCCRDAAALLAVLEASRSNIGS